MKLKDLLIQHFEALGRIRFSNSFGWICVYTGSNLFAGYKEVDENILIVWLILSPEKFKESLNDGFLKFDFGKTWAETEITSGDDIERVKSYIRDSFDFSKTRKKVKKIK